MAKRHQTNTRSRQDRPSDSDDAFVAGVLEFSNWAKANQKILVVFSVAVVAVVLLAVSYSNQRARQIEQAGLELERIHATLSVGDAEAAKGALSQYLEQFGGTPYAGEASLLLSRLYLESEQPELALRSLDRADLSLRDPLGAQAFTLRARAQEMAGDLGLAEETYLDVADGASMSFERTAARTQAARLREAQGNWAGAAALYDEILSDLEMTDPERGRYEMRLAEARTRGAR
jgi:predicted negative regulator of RcsB-dependent stress response